MRQKLDKMRVATEVDVLRVVDQVGDSALVGLRDTVAKGAVALAAGPQEIACVGCEDVGRR